jgi:glycosyltransferase involved in cell wall biosynthesis
MDTKKYHVSFVNYSRAPLLSICIPTYNRSQHLANCLESIKNSLLGSKLSIEICISDNASIDNTLDVVNRASIDAPIKFNRNLINLGMAQNFLNVVSMATGEFIWLIGDDDLVIPDGLVRLLNLIETNKDIDFFYVNAYQLNIDYLSVFPHPFNTKFLPIKMEKFSKISKSRKLNFLELISPEISFDFLGGIFLSVFRREKWLNSVHHLCPEALSSKVTFSHFDNTFPHIKIWASAFNSSKAYLNSDPMIVCLSGVREWAPLSSMVMSHRLPEALDVYRYYGLGFWRYLYCMNFALRNFFPDLVSMILKRKTYNFDILFLKLFIKSLPYPNTYLSIFYFCKKKIKSIKLLKPIKIVNFFKK